MWPRAIKGTPNKTSWRDRTARPVKPERNPRKKGGLPWGKRGALEVSTRRVAVSRWRDHPVERGQNIGVASVAAIARGTDKPQASIRIRLLKKRISGTES